MAPRVTRQQAAAAAAAAAPPPGSQDDDPPAATTKPVATKKPVASKKRTIARATDSDPIDVPSSSDATTSAPKSKKRKTTTKTAKATSSDPIVVPRSSQSSQPDASTSTPQPQAQPQPQPQRKTAKTAKTTQSTKSTAGKNAAPTVVKAPVVKAPVVKAPVVKAPVVKVKDDEEDELPTQLPEKKKTVAEGGFATSKNLVVPIDPAAARDGRLDPTFTVHIDADGMIWDTSLNQTNAANNNNKFYIAQVLENKATGKFFCWTRWGRVGDTGQSALLGQGFLGDAETQFKKKFKDKSGLKWEDRTLPPKAGKYTWVEKSYDPDTDDEDGGDKKVKKENEDKECTLDKPIRELVELIFNQKNIQKTMASFNYDAEKLPLGKLGRTTISRGFQALKDLGAVLQDNAVAKRDYDMTPLEAIEFFSNKYYSFIPHSFGRNRPPLLNSIIMLKHEIGLLESLSDLKAAADILKSDVDTSGMHELDRQFHGLNLKEMTPLDPSSTEFKTLTAYLNKSTGATHRLEYKVIDVFRIARPFEKERFQQSEFAKIKSDKRLLWHGSRCTNYGGILSQGLRIAPPEAPVTGYMFDKGIYLADVSSKSANYTYSHTSDKNGLLLLCEAELGSPMQELQSFCYNAAETAKKGGKVSTMGQGIVGPQRWIDASVAHPSLKGIKMPDPKLAPGPTNIKNSTLQYNEYICYSTDQVQLRYLFRVKIL